MSKEPPKKLRPSRKWRISFVILAILGLGALAAGAAIWWNNRPIEAIVLSPPEQKVLDEKLSAIEADPGDPEYVPGGKEIVLTERELNGLLHDNTGLGDQLKLELASKAIHARISADIPEDFPIMSGKKLKGRARFFIADEHDHPALILDDLTIWGISLPNAWLGDIKGRNLLGEILGKSSSGGLAGVEDIEIARGKLIIRLED